MIKRLIPYIFLAGILAMPPVVSRLTGRAGAPPTKDAEVALMVLSPHNESIRREFGEAFEAWWHTKTGKFVHVDWRNVGGANDCIRFLNTRFAADFGRREPALYGAPGVAANLFDPRADASVPAFRDARAAFVKSECSSGLDVFFGGGDDNFADAASVGQLVPALSQEGDAALFVAIPEKLRGRRLRDAQGRWHAAALSGFGIVYNRDLLRRAGIGDPREWGDLCDAKLSGLVGLADPTKSGTAYKAFEGVAMSAMRRELAAGKSRAEAWRAAFGALTRLALNASVWADSASGPVFDTARGDVGAAMAVDFYGRAQVEDTARRGGGDRVGFVLPADSPISADPVAVLRGAPHPELARDFVRFVLSREGQRLWTLGAGEPGGPKYKRLFRLPVRADAYPESESTNPFKVNGEDVAGEARLPVSSSVLRLALTAGLIDVREELREVVRSGNLDRAAGVLGDDAAFSLESLESAVKRAGGSAEKMRAERIRLTGLRRERVAEATSLRSE